MRTIRKKTYLKTITLSAITLLAFSGCGKKNNPTPASTETKTQLLVKGSWLETRDQMKSQDGTLVDRPLGASYSFTFKFDGTFTAATGGVPSTGGTWSITNDSELKITYSDGNDDSVTYDISINDSTLTCSASGQFTYPNADHQFITYYGEIFTYSH